MYQKHDFYLCCDDDDYGTDGYDGNLHQRTPWYCQHGHSQCHPNQKGRYSPRNILRTCNSLGH